MTSLMRRPGFFDTDLWDFPTRLSFRRSFQMPDTANEDDLKARYENGVLRITIGKRKGAETKPSRTVTIE